MTTNITPEQHALALEAMRAYQFNDHKIKGEDERPELRQALEVVLDGKDYYHDDHIYFNKGETVEIMGEKLLEVRGRFSLTDCAVSKVTGGYVEAYGNTTIEEVAGGWVLAYDTATVKEVKGGEVIEIAEKTQINATLIEVAWSEKATKELKDICANKIMAQDSASDYHKEEAAIIKALADSETTAEKLGMILKSKVVGHMDKSYFVGLERILTALIAHPNCDNKTMMEAIGKITNHPRAKNSSKNRVIYAQLMRTVATSDIEGMRKMLGMFRCTAARWSHGNAILVYYGALWQGFNGERPVTKNEMKALGHTPKPNTVPQAIMVPVTADEDNKKSRGKTTIAYTFCAEKTDMESFVNKMITERGNKERQATIITQYDKMIRADADIKEQLIPILVGERGNHREVVGVEANGKAVKVIVVYTPPPKVEKNTVTVAGRVNWANLQKLINIATEDAANGKDASLTLKPAAIAVEKIIGEELWNAITDAVLSGREVKMVTSETYQDANGAKQAEIAIQGYSPATVIDTEAKEKKVNANTEKYRSNSCVYYLGENTIGEPIVEGQSKDKEKVAASMFALVARYAKDNGIGVSDLKVGKGQLGQARRNEVEVASAKLIPHTERVMVLLHEIAHIKLGHTDKNNENRATDRKTKEVQAECVAYMVGANLGVESKFAGAYLRSYGATPEDVRKNFDAVLDATNEICRGVDATKEKLIKEIEARKSGEIKGGVEQQSARPSEEPKETVIEENTTQDETEVEIATARVA